MDVWLVVLVGATQVILTWYGVHVSVQEKRIRNAVVIGLVGLVGVVFMGWGADRAEHSQEQLKSQIEGIKEQLDEDQSASVGLYDIYVWPGQEML
ncbi:MAG: hypothetical protein WA369_18530, partial [Candidatus Acidiferrales bacterium]